MKTICLALPWGEPDGNVMVLVMTGRQLVSIPIAVAGLKAVWNWS